MITNDNDANVEGMPVWIAREVLYGYFNNGRQPDLTDKRFALAINNFDCWRHYEMQRIMFGSGLTDKIYVFREKEQRRLNL